MTMGQKDTLYLRLGYYKGIRRGGHGAELVGDESVWGGTGGVMRSGETEI